MSQHRLSSLASIVVLLGLGCRSNDFYDFDGDGAPDSVDCSTEDPTIYPGAYEDCDDGIDNDCDGDVDQDDTGCMDRDGDGYTGVVDCDDEDADVNPGAEEICDDGIDNDCNGTEDANDPFCDADVDGDGYTGADGDCNDESEGVHPGADEGCDGIDTDCDGELGPAEIDADADGHSECDGDCDDHNDTLNLLDADGDGWTSCDGDCDDGDNATHPTADELCDGLDNDCDGALADEEDDDDGDGYRVCDGDCDDWNPTFHPAALDSCEDGLDTDCDGLLDCQDSDCWSDVHCPLAGLKSFGAGSFTMGSPADEVGRYSDEETAHLASLTQGFGLGQTEVTQAEFRMMMAWDPSTFAGCDPCPVETISWYDALVFTNVVSVAAGLDPCFELTNVECVDGSAVGSDPMDCMNTTQGGIASADTALNGVVTPYECEGFRLPTEAEWEMAARSAGAVSDAFPDGGNLMAGDDAVCDANLTLDDGFLLDEQAWFCGNAAAMTHPVGLLSDNPDGLFDMAGNVFEWCVDGWDEGDYPGDETDPWGDPTAIYRVARGGSWSNMPGLVRSAFRGSEVPGLADDRVGLRLARSIP